MQRSKVLRKASHQKELKDIAAVSIKMGLVAGRVDNEASPKVWETVLIAS